MSKDNVELVRQAVEAVGRNDWRAVMELAAPEFVADLSRAVGPIHGVYDRDEWLAIVEDFASDWAALRFDAEELIDAGGDVVVPWTMYARGREGIEVPSRVTWVWTVRDGLIVRATMYQERDEALAAAGLQSSDS